MVSLHLLNCLDTVALLKIRQHKLNLNPGQGWTGHLCDLENHRTAGIPGRPAADHPPRSHHLFFSPLLIYCFTLQYGRWQQCTFKLDASCPACAHQLRRRRRRSGRRRSPSSSKDVHNRNNMDVDNTAKKWKEKGGAEEAREKKATFR